MNLYAEIAAIVRESLAAMVAAGDLPAALDFAGVTVEPPRDASHGDVATNAAMVLAKAAGMPPRAIAEPLAARLAAHADIAAAEVAGPGFINLRLGPDIWPRLLAAIDAGGDAYGRSTLGQGRAVNIEYVSANPTGPMHVGHCRGAVFGDALANLLTAAGFAVTREYYINDAGAQVDVLARSAFLRYREALGEDIGEIPSGLYPGDYLVPVGQALAARHGRALLDRPEAEWLPLIRAEAVAAMMALIRTDLASLGITHDVFFSEASLTTGRDAVAETVADLMARGLIYQGRLPAPKGKLPDDWEDREQTLFRATQFGDDVDRALIKADGSYTYFAADMAYHRDKLRRGHAELIDVMGADHGGYVRRMQAAVAALSDGGASLDVRLCQIVRVLRDGEIVRMSKRAGSFITLAELVEEVGAGVVRFIMLTRKNDAPLDFDLARAVEQTRDNPVFYVQYAHARASSVLRAANAAGKLGIESPQDALKRLDDVAELAVIKRLAQYPRQLEAAADAHEPHRIAFYLYDLAAEFHGLWSRGKDLPSLRFIREDDAELTRARLVLVGAVATVIRSGLGIIGVSAVSEMR